MNKKNLETAYQALWPVKAMGALSLFCVAVLGARFAGIAVNELGLMDSGVLSPVTALLDWSELLFRSASSWLWVAGFAASQILRLELQVHRQRLGSMLVDSWVANAPQVSPRRFRAVSRRARCSGRSESRPRIYSS